MSKLYTKNSKENFLVVKKIPKFH